MPWSFPNNRHMSCSWLTDFLSARRNSVLHAIQSYLLKLLNQSPNEITNSIEGESSRKTVHFVQELKRHPNILPNLVFSEFTAFFSETKTSSHGSSIYNGYLPGRQADYLLFVVGWSMSSYLRHWLSCSSSISFTYFRTFHVIIGPRAPLKVIVKRTKRGQVQYSFGILRLSRPTITTFLVYYLNRTEDMRTCMFVFTLAKFQLDL